MTSVVLRYRMAGPLGTAEAGATVDVSDVAAADLIKTNQADRGAVRESSGSISTR